MAVLAAISSATPSLQSMLVRSRVEQARREADLAEADARQLRQQADEQERVGQQARGRAQTLEKNAPASAAPTQSDRPEYAQATPQQIEPTYLTTLGAVFRVAQPVLAMDISATQKNIVKSSLFEATNTRWSVDQTPISVTGLYARRATAQPTSMTGRLLNTTV